MKVKEDKFKVLRKIAHNPDYSQRKMSKKLGISVGKLNYCINELRKKGLVKIQNFKNNENKFNRNSNQNYFYILTPRGIALKTKLTIDFMKRKLKEYDELKKELNINNEK
tara:strand:+ start:4261 stop:4590 length:330 start_codon:yes stop_codon:yes gene_type:complete